jgi:hypothetical protein
MSLAKREDLHLIAARVRKRILGRKPSRDQCFVVCSSLQGTLLALGYDPTLVVGEINGEHDHIWLRLPDGRILDPTADQFKTPTGEPMPAVYLGPLPTWYAPEEENKK